MDRPFVGVSVIIRKDNTYLLGLRKGSHGSGTWAFPGGHLEKNESIVECAKREIKEELNVNLENIIVKNYYTEDIFEGKHYITLYVEANIGNQIVENMEPHKCEELQWFYINEFPKNLFYPLSQWINNFS